VQTEGTGCHCRTPQCRFNPLNTKLNPICHLLALLAVYLILHISRIRVKEQDITAGLHSADLRNRMKLGAS